MKKLLILTAVFALVFAACGDDTPGEDNSDVIGIWTGSYGASGEVSLNINAGNWTCVYKPSSSYSSSSSINGDAWTRSGNTLELKSNWNAQLYSITASLSNGKLTASFGSGYNIGVVELAKAGADTTDPTDPSTDGTTLKIKNESSKIILDVLWNNVYFGDKSSEFNGTWTGNYAAKTASPTHPAGTIEVEIGSSSWSTYFKDDDDTLVISNGTLGTKTGNIQNLNYGGYNCGSLSMSGNKLILQLNMNFPYANRRETYELSKLGDAFKPGTNETKDVEAGSGYIFFKVGSTAYRTQTLVLVEKSNEAEFTFNDYTLVVEVSGSGNAVTLGSL